MPTLQDELKTLNDTIKQQRDELNVQLHLAKEDVKDDLAELEKSWGQLTDKMADIAQTAESAGKDIMESAKELGLQIKDGYERVKSKL